MCVTPSIVCALIRGGQALGLDGREPRHFFQLFDINSPLMNGGRRRLRSGPIKPSPASRKRGAREARQMADSAAAKPWPREDKGKEWN